MDEEEIEAYEDVFGEEGSEEGSDIGAEDYGDFTEYNPEEQEFQMGYKQLEQVSYGDIEAVGLSIAGGGKLEKMQKILTYETASKESQYINLKLRPALLKVFGEDSQDLVSNYMYSVKKIPRFEVKNADALSAALYMMHFNSKGISSSTLKTSAEKLFIDVIDLYRYYKLVKMYI